MKFESNSLPPIEALEHTQNKIEKENRDLSEMMPISYPDLKAICSKTDMTEKAFTEMVRYASEYVTDVWNMRQLVQEKTQYSDEEWAEKLAKADTDRTRLHDMYIESIGILSRALLKEDLNTDWVRELMVGGKLHRAACGKFAIMLTYSKYVNATKGDDNV